MMNPDIAPRLRNIEPVPRGMDDGMPMFALRDPSGLSSAVLTVSMPVLSVLALMDGQTPGHVIRARFQEQWGAPLTEEDFGRVVELLDKAVFLQNDAFERRYEEMLAAYRAAGIRFSAHAEAMGITADDGAILREVLGPSVDIPLLNGALTTVRGRVRGIIAPHLDYPRGLPCYRMAYQALVGAPPPTRVVLLGTNHRGRSTSVVGTRNAFETPLGRVPVDSTWLDRLESELGSLCRFELDHANEHSVELQLLLLQHLFGGSGFSIVPFLCPCPCGTTGTRPADGEGADLADFAEAIHELLKNDEGDTLLLAGADLSHVGRAFGDDRDLDEASLSAVERWDREALKHLEAASPEAFVEALTVRGNSTRVCSAGCMFVLARALRDRRPRLLGYHQAVTRPLHNCVTCCAMIYEENGECR